MINFWTCTWLVPHKSGTRRDGRAAGPDLGEFSSQAGGKEVLGNSVGKGREGKRALAEPEGCQLFRCSQKMKGSEEKQHNVGIRSEAGGKIFKKGEGWSLSLYRDRSKRSK